MRGDQTWTGVETSGSDASAEGMQKNITIVMPFSYCISQRNHTTMCFYSFSYQRVKLQVGSDFVILRREEIPSFQFRDVMKNKMCS